jgi:hypothetical protein
MTEKEHRFGRRSLLKGTTVAGIGSLAGCSALSNLEETDGTSTTRQSQTKTPKPTTNVPRWTGPLVSRPKKGKQPGHEYFVDQGPQQGALYVWQDGAWQFMNEYAEHGSFASLNGVRFASRYATGGTGTKKDPWVLDSSVMPSGGMVFFEPGNFVSNGLTTPTETNYEKTSVYLTGAGIRTTELIDDGTDGSLITFDAKKNGNFGGVSDMGIFGQYPDGKRSKGDLIHGTGEIIDTIYENLIVRYSWGHGMYLNGSTSGTRIRNCWIENNAGWNLFLGSGTRTKLSNLHIISGSGGIHLNPSNSQISNVSMLNCSPGIEIMGQNNQVSNCYIEQTTDGVAFRGGPEKENTFSNICVSGAMTGILAQGARSQYTNIGVRETKNEAVRVEGPGISVSNLSVSNFGKNQTAAIDVSGSDCRLSGVSISQPSGDYASNVVATISGDRTVLSDVACHGAGTWQININKGASETVLDNVRGVTLGTLQDQGVRTLLNRRGTNSGDPRTGGEWAGHGEYASAMDATVWNTRTTPWTPYWADGAGNWVRI